MMVRISEAKPVIIGMNTPDSALGNQSVIPSDIKYTKSTIEFSAVSHGKTVVPLIVETKHL
jgi:hypothetical protein